MQGFMVPVSQLLGRPGEYRDVTVTAVLPGVGTSLAHVDERPVTAELRLESVIEGVLASGRVRCSARVECARCLRPLETAIDVSVTELFVAPGHEAEADEDAYRVSGSAVDLEPLVRDAVGLALPLNPLCDAACAGLCARCGADLNAGPCGCADDDIDPRWAPLADLGARLAGDG